MKSHTSAQVMIVGKGEKKPKIYILVILFPRNVCDQVGSEQGLAPDRISNVNGARSRVRDLFSFRLIRCQDFSRSLWYIVFLYLLSDFFCNMFHNPANSSYHVFIFRPCLAVMFKTWKHHEIVKETNILQRPLIYIPCTTTTCPGILSLVVVSEAVDTHQARELSLKQRIIETYPYVSGQYLQNWGRMLMGLLQ